MSTFDTIALLALFTTVAARRELPYAIVDTGQRRCYDEKGLLQSPEPGRPFHGQDAQYEAGRPSFGDNGDGTVSDRVTGLMWTRDPGEKLTLARALEGASTCRVGGYDDWRLPTIKELYSLIQFSGIDPDPRASDGTGLVPFIDDSVFSFRYGDVAAGERVLDAQYASSTRYVGTTMHGNETLFGVNFADGRIKGYPVRTRRGEGRYHVLYVRGNTAYGKNDFVDNGDGTVTDRATGLTWMQGDSGRGMDWRAALEYASSLELAGYGDWRLPNAKELQSIVDYSRSPDTTGSAAIDPIFHATAIENEGGAQDYGWYWTGTSHRRGDGADAAVYVAFGRALGYMRAPGSDEYELLDVHGAGAQRSDPKSGDAARFPRGRGPQGDVIRIENLVRCVRGGGAQPSSPEAAPLEREARPTGGPGRGPGLRDGRTGRDEGAHLMRRFDRDRDGQVTRAEFDGPPARFRRLDRDSDGVLSRAEISPAAAPGPPPAQVAAAPARAQDADARTPFNIVLVLIDDLGWTGLSVQSDERVAGSRSDFYQTPHLAKLAEQGMRFSRAYAPAALCTPSRASILTGRTPAGLHITTPGVGGRARPDQRLVGARSRRELPLETLTTAEALAAAGYSSAHFGKWHLGRSGPGEHGFEVHDGATANDGPGAFADPNPKDVFGLTQRAIEFVRAQSAAGRPFFLQLSHYALHEPFEALQTSRQRFSALSAGARHDDVERAAMTYDLDAGIGTLLAEIDVLGLAESTFVVVTSDNGAAGGARRGENAPLRGGKGSLYEGGLRVPLIIRGPGVAPASACDANVVGFDLYPTFCQWAGVEVPAAVEGASLVPLLEGRPDRFERPQEALLFHDPHYGQGPLQVPRSALLLGDYKLIRDLESGVLELFDLARSPSEQEDLSSEHPERAAELGALLDERLAAVGAQMPTENPDYDPEAKRERHGRGRP